MTAVRQHWLPVALLCTCMAAPATAAVLPTDLEPKVGPDYQPVGSEEREIWEALERAEEAIRNSPQRLIAPELEAYTLGIVERLIGRPAPDLRVYLMHDSSLNAVMLPSGMMIVNTGLLARVRNEAQLAAVLGHEAGHYFRRHALDLYRDSHRKSAMATAAAGALNTYSESYGGWAQLNYAIMMSAFKFSRDLESEADAYGLMLMARAGYPPRAAYTMWGQVVDERRASAAARHKRYRDGTNSETSTHPPTEGRMGNLADTADYLAGEGGLTGEEGDDAWADAIHPYQPMLLREQVYLNDPGASLYLLENLAADGWSGVLRFYEGEVYRLRDAKGDDLKAASAYAAATAMADAPPEAWRAHGYALLKSSKAEAHEALERYLEMKSEAPDAAMIRFILADDESPGASGEMIVNPGSDWKRLPASGSQTQWEKLWTWRGPQLDRTTLIEGLPDGKPIIFQKKNADQEAPIFRAGMTVQDLTSMIEVSYRVNGVTVFNFESVEPVDFLDGPGIRLRYNYASGIGFAKWGSCVMRVINQKLYAMKLEGVVNESFDTVIVQFDQLVASARLRQQACRMSKGRACD